MSRFLPITDIYAREMINSIGNMTIEVEVVAGEHSYGSAQVSAHRRDWSQKAVAHINENLSRELIEQNVFEQSKIDQMLFRLCEEKYSEAVRGISLAVARCAAAAAGLSLYRYLGGNGHLQIPEMTMRLADQIYVLSEEGHGSHWKSHGKKIEIKLSQEVTVTGLFEKIAYEKSEGKAVLLSDEEGETEDTALVDFAVASGCEYVMIGRLNCLEQALKYNRLRKIMED